MHSMVSARRNKLLAAEEEDVDGLDGTGTTIDVDSETDVEDGEEVLLLVLSILLPLVIISRNGKK